MDQYDLLKYSHKRSYGWVIDGKMVDSPYYDFCTNAARVPFLGVFCDGDALYFAPDWIVTPNEGNFEIYKDYAKSLTTDRGEYVPFTPTLGVRYC